jgi:hypothetical protein
MFFLHINSKNFDKYIKKLNNIIANKDNKVFILYYMEGCGPCNATRPEWNKIENIMKNTSGYNNVYVIDIDQILSSKINNLPEPSSFPTMKFITNSGKIIENYEDSSLPDEKKNRTIDSFIEWINLKSNHSENKIKIGGKFRGKKTRVKNKKLTRKYRKTIKKYLKKN